MSDRPAPAPAPTLVHATAIALGGDAVLIRGPSGSGKSDLALRAISLPTAPFADRQFTLVSDDQVVVTPDPTGGLAVSPPATIAGLIEVRGVGLVPVPHTPRARLRLVVDLAPSHRERLPPSPLPTTLIAGCQVRCADLAPFETSAPLKLLLLLLSSISPPSDHT